MQTVSQVNGLPLVTAAATVTLTLFSCVRWMQRPIEEVFDAGREYERRCMLRQLNGRPGVAPLRGSRRRVVTERVKGGAG